MTKEYWKPVVGYENRYTVSNKGRVRTLDRAVDGKVVLGRSLRLGRSLTGYCRISLSDGLERKTMLVHRLVAIAFIPNTQNKPHINHLDGNKENNHPSNLEWCTPEENTKHGWATGLMRSRSGFDKGWKEKAELAKRLYEENKMTIDQILIECGIGSKATMYTYIKAVGCETGKTGGGRPKGITPESQKKAIHASALYLDGMATKEICSTIGMSQATLYKYLKYEGVDIKQYKKRKHKKRNELKH